MSRPLVQHTCPLPDSQSNARPAFDLTLEQRTRFIQVDAGIEPALDLGAVLGPISGSYTAANSSACTHKPACLAALDALSVD